MFVLTWIVKDFLGTLGPKDKKRLENGLGLWSPEMTPHWKRLAETKGLDGHSLVNIGTEWVRLDSQRAFKVGVDTTALSVLAILALVVL